MDLHLCADRPTAARQERAASEDASLPLSFVFSVQRRGGSLDLFRKKNIPIFFQFDLA